MTKKKEKAESDMKAEEHKIATLNDKVNKLVSQNSILTGQISDSENEKEKAVR